MAKYGKLIATVVSLLLGAIGLYVGADLKGMVCGSAAPVAEVAK